MRTLVILMLLMAVPTSAGAQTLQDLMPREEPEQETPSRTLLRFIEELRSVVCKQTIRTHSCERDFAHMLEKGRELDRMYAAAVELKNRGESKSADDAFVEIGEEYAVLARMLTTVRQRYELPEV